jgi:uncharacterized protein (TIGR00251 family)
MHNCYRIAENGIQIAIKAVPGASKTEFAGEKNVRLRMRIAAAPEDGKANVELIAFFAKTLGCPKRDIVLLHGERSRLKTLVIPLAYKVQLEKIIKEV